MPFAAPSHRAKRDRFLKKEDRKRYDATRGTSAERGYDGNWRRSREHFLSVNPMCDICLKKYKKYVPATDVHHRMKAVDHPDKFYNSDYWQALCHGCHSRLTANGE